MADDDLDDPAPPADAGGGETDSTAARWWLTNDVLAIALVAGFYATMWGIGVGWLRPTVLTSEAGIAMLVYTGVAVAWAFGADAVRAWRGQ